VYEEIDVPGCEEYGEEWPAIEGSSVKRIAVIAFSATIQQCQVLTLLLHIPFHLYIEQCHPPSQAY
jgi:hypothetical protein